MPIKTRCQCGAAFAAPEKLAGRKVKCPKCSQPVSVPVAGRAAAAASSSNAAIGVRCKCGKPLKVPAQMAGKQVICPSCSTAVQVPNPARSSASATAAASGLAPDDGGVGDLLDEAELNLSKTGRRCPECRSDLQLDDILCVNCGYNTETGKKITVKKVEKGQRVGGVVLQDLDTQSKPDAPPPVQSLVKLLNQAGGLAVLLAIGIVAFLGYQKMQAEPKLGADAFLAVLTGSGGYILAGFVLLVTIPCAITANLVQSGKALGRILSIVMGFVTLPVFLLGALILKLAFSDDVSRYCR